MDAEQLEHIEQMIEGGLYLVPQHMHGAVRRYYLKGIPPGSFLEAVISNDLMGAFSRADDVNSSAMREWCQFFYNHVPSGSYGSPERYGEWLARFRVAA